MPGHRLIRKRQVDSHIHQYIGEPDIADEIEGERAMPDDTLEESGLGQRRQPIIKPAIRLWIEMEPAVAAPVSHDALVEVIAYHVYDQARGPVGRGGMMCIGEV